MISAFLEALGAVGPSTDRAGKMDLYGRFVGSWDLDVRQFSDDGRERRRAGEWHFGWALEGRAIQDVWIVPPRGEAAPRRRHRQNQFLRHDAAGLRSRYRRLADPVDRSGGAKFPADDRPRRRRDIVQLGTRPDGQLMRWSFSEITPNSFLWRGEISADNGASWRVNTEFTATSAASHRDLSHRSASPPFLASPVAPGWHRPRGPRRIGRSNHDWS